MSGITAIPFGDAAVMVAGVPGSDGRARVRSIGRLLEDRTPHGVTELVSGLDSLLVRYDPLRTTAESITDLLRLLDEGVVEETEQRETPGRVFTIPVVFNAGAGPDLEPVAAELGQTVDQLVDDICAATFDVVLLAAGMAPMMEGGHFARPVRRATQPRTNVPPGSIMIAGQNAIIQPFPGPTGWRVVGRTPHEIVDIARASAAAILPGDSVRFMSVGRADAEQLGGTFLEPDAITDAEGAAQ